MGMASGGGGADYGDDDDGYKPMAEINITPMVDVMLVLLIIFMVAAPLMVQGVPLDLPKTSAAKLQPLRKPAIVSLTAEGQIEVRLGELVEKVDKSRLVGRLMELKPEIGDGVVYVRADRRNPYGDVMELLGRVGEAGLSRISLLSQPQQTQASEGGRGGPPAGGTGTGGAK